MVVDPNIRLSGPAESWRRESRGVALFLHLEDEKMCGGRAVRNLITVRGCVTDMILWQKKACAHAPSGNHHMDTTGRDRTRHDTSRHGETALRHDTHETT